MKRKILIISLLLLGLIKPFGQNSFINFKYCPQTKKEIPVNLSEDSFFSNEELVFDYFWLLIASFESYSYEAYPDHGRIGHGFGTEASTINDAIGLEDAKIESQMAFKRRIQGVREDFPQLTLWQTHSIAAFEYNVCRSRWGSITAKIMKGNSKLIVSSMIKYVKASGEVEDGLKIRRKVEAEYLLAEDDYGKVQTLHEATIERFISKNSQDIFDRLNVNMYL